MHTAMFDRRFEQLPTWQVVTFDVLARLRVGAMAPATTDGVRDTDVLATNEPGHREIDVIEFIARRPNRRSSSSLFLCARVLEKNDNFRVSQNFIRDESLPVVVKGASNTRRRFDQSALSSVYGRSAPTWQRGCFVTITHSSQLSCI